MLKHILLNTNLTEVNMKMPIFSGVHKVMPYVGKLVIAQHMPEFQYVFQDMHLKHTVLYNESKGQS